MGPAISTLHAFWKGRSHHLPCNFYSSCVLEGAIPPSPLQFLLFMRFGRRDPTISPAISTLHAFWKARSHHLPCNFYSSCVLEGAIPSSPLQFLLFMRFGRRDPTISPAFPLSP